MNAPPEISDPTSASPGNGSTNGSGHPPNLRDSAAATRLEDRVIFEAVFLFIAGWFAAHAQSLTFQFRGAVWGVVLLSAAVHHGAKYAARHRGFGRDSAAWGALAAELLLVALLSLPLRAANGEAAVAAMALLFRALPIAGTTGFEREAARLRRTNPQLVATRLARRISGTFVAIVLVGAVVAFGALAWSSERARAASPIGIALSFFVLYRTRIVAHSAVARSLARETALQRGTWSSPGYRPLAPAQYAAFQVACEAAYERWRGTFESRQKPATTKSSSTPTEAP